MMKKLALLFALFSLLSLTACGGSSDGSKEAADALRKEAAEDGIDLDELIKSEQEAYEKEKEEKAQAKATQQEALEKITPEAEAIISLSNTILSTTGIEVVESVREYNDLLTAYVEKWKGIDFENLASQSIHRSIGFVFPDTIINLMSALYNNVNIEDYEGYDFYFDKNNPDNIYVLMRKGDFYLGDIHVLKLDGSIYNPDLSSMDAPAGGCDGFADGKFYVSYGGYGDHPYRNWCFDMSGDSSGVGNNEEIVYDDMYQLGTWYDGIHKAFVDFASQYNSFHGSYIWQD